jgi:hypothetical protein
MLLITTRTTDSIRGILGRNNTYMKPGADVLLPTRRARVVFLSAPTEAMQNGAYTWRGFPPPPFQPSPNLILPISVTWNYHIGLF